MNNSEKLRAISIRKPYAEAILRGEKIIEYRTRNTNIRYPELSNKHIFKKVVVVYGFEEIFYKN